MKQGLLGILLNPKQGKKRERRNTIIESWWKVNTKSTNNCKFFNDYFLKKAEKLTGANQSDKMRRLKNRVLIHYILQNCRCPYPNGPG